MPVSSSFVPVEQAVFGNFYSQPTGTLVLPQYGRPDDVAILAERDAEKIIIMLDGEQKGRGYALTPDDHRDRGIAFPNARVQVDPTSIVTPAVPGGLVLQQGGLVLQYKTGSMDFVALAYVKVPTEEPIWMQSFSYARWRVVLRDDGRDIELYRYDASIEA